MSNESNYVPVLSPPYPKTQLDADFRDFIYALDDTLEHFWEEDWEDIEADLQHLRHTILVCQYKVQEGGVKNDA